MALGESNYSECVRVFSRQQILYKQVVVLPLLAGRGYCRTARLAAANTQSTEVDL